MRLGFMKPARATLAPAPPRLLAADRRMSMSSAVSDASSSTSGACRDAPTLQRAALYVFGEKSQAKVLPLASRLVRRRIAARGAGAQVGPALRVRARQLP